VRFVHSADWHLGAINQPNIYAEAPHRLVDWMLQQGLNTVVVAGDIFDKANPSQSVKDTLLSLVLEYPQINFVFSVGNHDFETKSHDYHSLMTYKVLSSNINNVTVLSDWPVTSWSWKTIKDLTFVNLPTDIDWRKEHRALRHCAEFGTNLVAVWHGILPGLDLRTYDTTVCGTLVNEFLREYGIRYLSLGDIHKRLQITEFCYYPGALTPKTFACEDGFLVVDISDEKVFVESYDATTLKLPKRVTLDLLLETGDTEESLAAQIKAKVPAECVLKLSFSMTISSWAVFNKKALLELLEPHCLSVKMQNNPIPEKRTREGLQNFRSAQTLMDELNLLMDQMEGMSDLDHKKLLLVCQQIADSTGYAA